MSAHPFIEQRNKLIAAYVSERLAEFLGGKAKRRCPSCGTLFEPRQRWHFFCPESECRAAWYRGQFRTPDTLAPRKRRKPWGNVRKAARRGR